MQAGQQRKYTDETLHERAPRAARPLLRLLRDGLRHVRSKALLLVPGGHGRRHGGGWGDGANEKDEHITSLSARSIYSRFRRGVPRSYPVFDLGNSLETGEFMKVRASDKETESMHVRNK